MVELGGEYRDKITGYQGICTGYVRYLTGCNQALIAAPVINGVIGAEWIDEQRLERVGAKTIILDNSKGAGFDKVAPKR